MDAYAAVSFFTVKAAFIYSNTVTSFSRSGILKSGGSSGHTIAGALCLMSAEEAVKKKAADATEKLAAEKARADKEKAIHQEANTGEANASRKPGSEAEPHAATTEANEEPQVPPVQPQPAPAPSRSRHHAGAPGYVSRNRSAARQQQSHVHAEAEAAADEEIIDLCPKPFLPHSSRKILLLQAKPTLLHNLHQKLLRLHHRLHQLLHHQPVTRETCRSIRVSILFVHSDDKGVESLCYSFILSYEVLIVLSSNHPKRVRL